MSRKGRNKESEIRPWWNHELLCNLKRPLISTDQQVYGSYPFAYSFQLCKLNPFLSCFISKFDRDNSTPPPSLPPPPLSLSDELNPIISRFWFHLTIDTIDWMGVLLGFFSTFSYFLASAKIVLAAMRLKWIPMKQMNVISYEEREREKTYNKRCREIVTSQQETNRSALAAR